MLTENGVYKSSGPGVGYSSLCEYTQSRVVLKRKHSGEKICFVGSL